ncbi:hypothetical protein EYF80_014473 [Liparis tanakae]|uniref:Uncharacterized protein n=1 Tax=Liparis tanakae TaxID=230148 RepID=A0A4Z2IB76_9TELE|nr:hypothetical protein EYF80_014473 [Liparis tanakae]
MASLPLDHCALSGAGFTLGPSDHFGPMGVPRFGANCVTRQVVHGQFRVDAFDDGMLQVTGNVWQAVHIATTYSHVNSQRKDSKDMIGGPDVAGRPTEQSVFTQTISTDNQTGPMRKLRTYLYQGNVKVSRTAQILRLKVRENLLSTRGIGIGFPSAGAQTPLVRTEDDGERSGGELDEPLLDCPGTMPRANNPRLLSPDPPGL